MVSRVGQIRDSRFDGTGRPLYLTGVVETRRHIAWRLFWRAFIAFTVVYVLLQLVGCLRVATAFWLYSVFTLGRHYHPLFFRCYHAFIPPVRKLPGYWTLRAVLLLIGFCAHYGARSCLLPFSLHMPLCSSVVTFLCTFLLCGSRTWARATLRGLLAFDPSRLRAFLHACTLCHLTLLHVFGVLGSWWAFRADFFCYPGGPPPNAFCWLFILAEDVTCCWLAALPLRREGYLLLLLEHTDNGRRPVVDW